MSALSKEVIDLWASREWRLSNLYWIEDKHGAVVKFSPNEAQARLLAEMHYLNIVLKARQLGFSTFILLLALDCAIFNSHFAAGLVADTLDNAKNLLRRVKFAYERLPAEIKRVVPITTDNTSEVTFGNGSSVSVGVSLRSGTFNFLHISEYGKICAKFPDKAKEIKSGALNTLAPQQLAFIESTAEGRGGDFYDKTQAAQRLAELGKEPGDMDYKFHFFPWYLDAAYELAVAVDLTKDDIDYFDSLKTEHGITLSDAKKWWYAAKAREQGDDMWKEFPSSPDEAFKAAKEGAIYAKILRNLRQRKMIGKFPYVPGILVDTFWDFGLGDCQTIWLTQAVAGEVRFVGFYEASGEGLAHYFGWLDRWAAMRGARFGRHYAPHDVDHRRQGLQVKTIKQMASEVGFEFTTVQRNPDKWVAIEHSRTKLAGVCFDETECAAGLIHLEGYSKDWDEKLNVYRSYPRHDEHSHAADAFQTFADGYQAAQKSAPKFIPRKVL